MHEAGRIAGVFPELVARGAGIRMLRTCSARRPMSAFGGKADISQRLFALVSNSNFQILALLEGAPNSEERPSSCPPVELATWPSDDHCSRLVFITKNTREAQVRGLFDAARMLTTDATGPKR